MAIITHIEYYLIFYFTETCNFYKSLYDIGLKLPLSRQDTDRRLLTGSSWYDADLVTTFEK